MVGTMYTCTLVMAKQYDYLVFLPSMHIYFHCDGGFLRGFCLNMATRGTRDPNRTEIASSQKLKIQHTMLPLICNMYSIIIIVHCL